MSNNNRWVETANRVEAARRILTNTVVILAVVVILAAVGRYVAGSMRPGDNKVVQEKPIPPAIPWDDVDASVVSSLAEARASAEAYADRALHVWMQELMLRVDTDFLDWYFGYWNQQVLGLEGLMQYGVHFVLRHQPTAAEKLTEEIQEEFSRRVLRPEIAQLELERIVRNTTALYVADLRENLAEVPEAYRIPQGEWDRYLAGIAVTTRQASGTRAVPVTLKTVVLSGAGGAAVLAGRIGSAASSASGAVLARSGGRAASQVARKTGGKVAAKMGGKFLGTIVGVGVVIWDVWDHNRTKQQHRPILRAAINDYFTELRDILVHDPEAGLTSTLYDLERQVVASLPPQT